MMFRSKAVTALVVLAVAVFAVAMPVATTPAAASEGEHEHEAEHEHDGHHETGVSGQEEARDQAVRVLLLQAHLHAGKEFYDAGNKDAAVRHFKHFVNDLKGDVGDELAEHGFERNHILEEAEDALVNAVVRDQPRALVLGVYRHTLSETDRQLAKVGSLKLRDPDFVLNVSDDLLKRAGRHYDAAVRGEQLNEPGEYHYARSIGHVARNFVGRVAADLRTRDQQAFERFVQAFDRLNGTMSISEPNGSVASAQTMRKRLDRVQVAAGSM